MKIQNMAVIFVLIIVPISFTLSSYMDNQIDVITMQSSYDNMLLNSTYDTVRAYQLNTLNNAYSSINDSKIRDINASVNTFYNSLASGMGVSGYRKDDLKNFIPALLFTMYDGYYVYGEYDNVIKTISTSESQRIVEYKENTNDSSNDYKDGIRPYIYYTCQYKGVGLLDVIVNYTLDNYMSVMGRDQQGNSINIAGYLINPDTVTNVNDGARTLTAQGVQIGPEKLGEYLVVVDRIKGGNGLGTHREHSPNVDKAKYYKYVYFNNQKYYSDPTPNKDNTSYSSVDIFRLENNERIYINTEEESKLKNYLGKPAFKEYQDISAFNYYKEAKTFSERVRDIMEEISPSNAVSTTYTTKKLDDEGKEIPKRDAAGQSKNLFDVGNSNDPTVSTSAFNEHRMAIIISSIESNLMSIIANFNLHANPGYQYVLPIINEEDWYTVANNISIVSFMQGLPIGNYKYYNNYAICANTKNKEFVSNDSIYVTKETGIDKDFDNEYHNPRCNNIKTTNGESYIGYKNIDFDRQVITYDNRYKVEQQVIYHPHVGIGSYDCIVTSASVSKTTDNLIENKNGVGNEIRRAYLTALAREKFVSYKVTSYFGSK